jgi:hypothetical protein
MVSEGEPIPDFIPIANGDWLLSVNNSAKGNVVEEIDSTGAVVRQSADLASFGEIKSLGTGPGGRLIVTTDNAVLLLKPDATTFDLIGQFTNLPGAKSPHLLPSGELGLVQGNKALIVDPDTGSIITQHDFAEPATGIVARSNGTLVVLTASDIWVLSADLSSVLKIIGIGGIVAPCLLPNGYLMVVMPASNVIDEIDLDAGTIVSGVKIAGETVVEAHAVPHRFAIGFDGVVAGAGGLQKVSASGVLTWRPGSSQAAVVFNSSATAIIGALGNDRFVLKGFEADDAGVKGNRVLLGEQVHQGPGSVGVEVTGTLGLLNNFYYPDKFTGTFQAFGSGTLVNATIKSGSLLNP